MGRSNNLSLDSLTECLTDSLSQVMSDEVWGHTPEQRVAAPILHTGLRLANAQADARPAMPISLR